MARVRVSLYLGAGSHKLGRGKIALLETIREHGSISSAARSLGMSYRHAWELVDSLNQCFAEPVVDASAGGREGGGAVLTPLALELIERFRRIERAAGEAIASEVAALERKLRES